MKKIIGLTYDLKSDWQKSADDPIDANAEFDSADTVNLIHQALETGGHEVKRIGNVRSLLSQIDDLGVDIVFNICEGIFGRNRESQVPIILEMHNIPYVGSDGLTLGITLDKVVAKKCFQADGIPTPRFFEAANTDNLERCNNIRFPLIVKARYEGTSKGLNEDSRVEDDESLKRQVDFINKKYDQPALVEEFIEGTEFTVAVIGNKKPEVMPVVQISIDGKVDLGKEFYTFSRLSSDGLQYVCPTKIPKRLNDRLQEIAIKVYQCVGCRDVGRVDFRVDKKGNPYVLEINPLPSFDVRDVFALVPKVLGFTYENMLNRILSAGLERYGLNGN